MFSTKPVGWRLGRREKTNGREKKEEEKRERKQRRREETKG